MAGIDATFKNIIELIGSLYPLFIISFLLIASVFNFTFMKGIAYLGGIVLCFITWMLTGKLFKKVRVRDSSLTCDLINFPGNFLIPNLPIIICFYTLVYLIIPMIENSLINPVVIAFLTIFSAITGYYQFINKCTSILGIIISVIIGTLLGTLWFTVFFTSNKKDMLFYNELMSNNVVCSKPRNQSFKCNVYRNGEIISSNVV